MATLEATLPDLPDYARTQAAFHRAFAEELQRAIASLPLTPDSRVLDVPCGDGFYSQALVARLSSEGRFVGADLSEAFLEHAQNRFSENEPDAPVEWKQADVYHLPFDDSSFDLVWCAESLITLRDPVAALTEMKRVVRPGGTVAVLEADAFHAVVMNWSVELELHLNLALAAATKQKYGSAASLSPSRRVRRWFQLAGLSSCRKRTLTADRQFPFTNSVQNYLSLHFCEMREFVAGHLPASWLKSFDDMIEPDNPNSIFRRSDAGLTCLTTLFQGQKK